MGSLTAVDCDPIEPTETQITNSGMMGWFLLDNSPDHIFIKVLDDGEDLLGYFTSLGFVYF